MVQCNCGGEMVYYRGPTEGSDYMECPECHEKVYVDDDTRWD